MTPAAARLALALGLATLPGIQIGLPGCLAATPPVSQPAAETVLFPFDDHALPLNKGLILTLVPGRKSATYAGVGLDRRHPGKPVLTRGGAGDPDEKRAYFMGTVIRVGDEYRMWYSGHDGHRRRVCLAVSADGLEWRKPKLGLVEYRGGTANNLVAIDGAQPMLGMSTLVLHEPDEPRPERRFKMIREIHSAELLAAVSPDGLRWRSVAGNRDILPGCNLEPGGLMKLNGVYHLNGHGGPIPHPIPTRGSMRPQKRMMVTLLSHDFENWTAAGHLSFRRDDLPPRTVPDFEFNRGEQVHLGASVWNRGSVVLGFYGQYHNPSNDRRDSSCDLGLVVSHDGLHFKEPLPDFKIVPGFEESDRAEPRLTQGQGFENIGDRTMVYYGIWPETDRDGPTGVRAATWPRDRLGYFSPAGGVTGAHCVSRSIPPARPATRVFVNATGMSEDARLTVEILDERFRPLPGYAATDFDALQSPSGLRLPVSWRGRDHLERPEHPVRIRINWTGKLAEQARLHAVYLE